MLFYLKKGKHPSQSARKICAILEDTVRRYLRNLSAEITA